MTEIQQDGRSARKRRAILDAARTLFLRNGYAGTSMDDVAALAAVSKQTVYKNFADKQRLFTDVITGDIAETEQLTQSLVDALPQSQDLERDLRTFARRHIVEVLQPHLVRMRRILIGEAGRFPDLASAWYASGPERAHATFARWFSALAERGLLRVPDPLLAAEHFNWLILSIPLNRAMFSGRDEPPDPNELEYFADEAVRVFLAAYGAPRPDRPTRTTDPRSSRDDPNDQDAEPAIAAPPEDRPDAGASEGSRDGRGDSPDVVDTDDAQEQG